MISICSRSLIRQLLSRNQFLFSTYRNANQSQDKDFSRSRRDFNGIRKLFRSDNIGKRVEREKDARNQNQTNVQEYVKAINQINKEFLGIKLNTDYFKVFNEKPFDEAIKADKSQMYKINDLPFAVKQKSSQQSESQQPTLKQTTAVKLINSMISEQKLMKELQRLASTYFTDIILKERKSRMEVNFQVYARKVLETLKSSRWNFKLSNTDATPKVVIKNVTLLKGVKVNRNDNYTIDSYQVNMDEAEEGIITYTLWKKAKEQYPETEWFAQKFIMARIQAQVSGCPTVDVTQQSSVSNSTKGLSHQFVFEADLTVPPSLSLLTLSQEEYLKSYRLKPENIYISNVDNKNVWYNIAFKEEEKKFKLINKLI